MPPRHKTASTASKTVVTDTVDIDTDRQFSGRPLDRELWYQSNKEQLMFECPGENAALSNQKLPRVAWRGQFVEKSLQKVV